MAMIDKRRRRRKVNKNYITLYLKDGTTLRFSKVSRLVANISRARVMFDYVSASTNQRCRGVFDTNKILGMSYSRYLEVEYLPI